jgi:tetratricopeptide (TPR) repeat protein
MAPASFYSPAESQALGLHEAMQRALAAYQRGDLRDAERLCRSALDVKPDYFDSLYLLGIIACVTGRTQEGIELLSKAVLANPNSADAHYNRGVALGESKRPAEAVEAYDRTIAIKSDYSDAYFNRGVALSELNHPAEALASYERAIALRPDYAEAYNNRGMVLGRLGDHEKALDSYERAIALKPDYVIAYNNRGATLGALSRPVEAIASYERAIALRPDYAEAHNNRGLVLHGVERYGEALAGFDRAIALKPDFADAYYNRGNALRELYRYREAIDSYELALALMPNHAFAHWNLADCRLLLGDFALGWKEYEWRWILQRPEEARRDFQQPLWLGGQSLEGRTILLHAELGLGDTLLFCRYAKQVGALGAKVVLEVQPPLRSLLADLEGVTQVLPKGAPQPAFDYHCPLMSLPLVFKTDLDSIPASIPYIHSDAARVAAWEQRLGKRHKPRVGLVWAGSMKLKNDKRSLRLTEVLPLIQDWAEWVSLQKEVPESDADLLATRPDIRHFGSALEDFADTAALVEHVDLVLSVDTSVAHLAAAMGKPVWIMVPSNPHDWRWMLDREDSPWYPTVRLFRQKTIGDWASVVRRVDVELVRRFGVRG